MLFCKVYKDNGVALDLNGQEPKWQFFNADGLNPPSAQINTTRIAGTYGSRFNSAFLNNRNIVLYLRINGDAERNRRELESFFPTGEKVRMRFTTERSDVFANGYVETVDYALFTINQVMQISVICPDPFLYDWDEIVVDGSDSLGGFEFPFAINIGHPVPFGTYEETRVVEIDNDSGAPTPVEIEVTFNRSTFMVAVYNDTLGEVIELRNGTSSVPGFNEGDVLVLNTDPLHPQATLNGTNIFNKVRQNSTFYLLAPGENVMTYYIYGPGANKARISYKYRKRYRGI